MCRKVGSGLSELPAEFRGDVGGDVGGSGGGGGGGGGSSLVNSNPVPSISGGVVSDGTVSLVPNSSSCVVGMPSALGIWFLCSMDRFEYAFKKALHALSALCGRWPWNMRVTRGVPGLGYSMMTRPAHGWMAPL